MVSCRTYRAWRLAVLPGLLALALLLVLPTMGAAHAAPPAMAPEHSAAHSGHDPAQMPQSCCHEMAACISLLPLTGGAAPEAPAALRPVQSAPEPVRLVSHLSVSDPPPPRR